METNGQDKGGVLSSVKETGDVGIERSLVGVVRARDVSIARSAAGPTLAGRNVSITQGGCGPVIAGGDVTIDRGGCGPMIARGGISIERGGCQSVIAGGGATLGRSSFVGVVLSPRVTVEEGGRVLMSVPQAAALGAVGGLVFALVRTLLRR
ncbi:MAG TPA: hypothetical protein VF382_04625 [Actinomycetota bacterium]